MGQLLVNTVFLFATQCLLACCFFVLFKPTRYFHVTHAITLLLSAYAMIALRPSTQSTWFFAISAMGAILVSAALGAVANLFYERLARGRDAALYVLVLSLGLYVIFQNTFSILFGDQLLRISSFSFADQPLIDSETIAMSLNQGFIVAIATVGVAALWALWQLTPLGRMARAISENRELSDIVGIDTQGVVLILAGISSAGAGLVGVLLVLDAGVTPTTGFNLLLPALTAVILGGNRSVLTTVVGAAVVSSLQTSTAFLLGSKWEPFAVYALLAAVLVLRPYGLITRPVRGV